MCNISVKNAVRLRHEIDLRKEFCQRNTRNAHERYVHLAHFKTATSFPGITNSMRPVLLFGLSEADRDAICAVQGFGYVTETRRAEEL